MAIHTIGGNMKFTIKQWRGIKGITQEQLAQKLGVSKVTIINWERGTHRPHKDRLEEMGELFGVKSKEIQLIK